MRPRFRTFLSAALFVALGLVGAFVVSALADREGEAPEETGFQTLEWGIEDPSRVRVEVLNGAGVGGLARDATHHLRGDGFDVVFFGNAGRFDHARSVAIDRTGVLDRARAVAAALGIDSVTTAIDSSLMLEVTVVLGRDWPPEPTPKRDWTDRIRELIPGDDPADSTDADSLTADPGTADTATVEPGATEGTPDPGR